MAATVYAARKKLTALLVSEDSGGQTNWTAEVEDSPVYLFIEGPGIQHAISLKPVTGGST